VRVAAAGQSALAPAITDRLVERLRSPTTALSTRETQVLTLVADGLSNQQIAARLFVSQATVKSHLVHIFAKLDADSRTAAVAIAVRRGLIRRSRPPRPADG
jgi:DNA-binding NarL/FixJ family response regulator